ncbi:MAG TPA: hypothetical protein PKK48_04220 [Phycisphaerae bacterium]|nr:hypothetical protein [Phycisphaerae bacterium]HPS52914.1 hypothetical protein [Phycisphaerae bacterium]
MSELYPSDAIINALSGTKDSGQEVQYPAIYETPYYTTFYKMIYRLLNVARRAGDFRIYKDGDLTFGVRAGKVSLGNSRFDFSGAAQQVLTDNATNSIYLTVDGVVHISTSGFPSVSTTAFIPLAIISTANGSYDFEDITDLRALSMFQFNTNLTPDNAQILTTSKVADCLHTHDSAGIANEALGGVHLNSQLRKSCSYAVLTTTDNANGTATITISIRYASGTSSTNLNLVRIWTSDSSLTIPSEQATLTIQQGLVMNTYQANVDLEILTAQTGNIVMLASSSANKSFHVHVEFRGIVDVYSVSITGN